MTDTARSRLWPIISWSILLLPFAVFGALVFVEGPIKPVVLWTDRLLYVLTVAVVVFAVYARRREHLHDPWRQVMRSRMGTAALVVLCAYVVVGFADSIHFRPALKGAAQNGEARYSAEVKSLLDVALQPIKDGVEKTYSAPFATHLFAKETVDMADGTQARIYPRLVFGGAHLRDPESDKITDIVETAVAGLGMGLLAWLAFAASILYTLSHYNGTRFNVMLQRVVRGQTDVPWHVILVTAGIVILSASLALALAMKYHILGTDKVGQDVFFQAMKSIRTGLIIGTLTTLVMLPFAVLLGLMAGYFRGWVDDVIQYLYTTLSSIPGVLLIAAAVLMMQVYMANHPEIFATVAERADIRLLFLCIILGITSWTGLCRLLRGETLKLVESDFIQAATAFGVGHFTIIARHLLPNVMHIVLISLVLDFSGLVLAEAVLSYVGVGVDPTMSSWGNMINGARLEMAREPVVWWSLAAAFVFMFVLVLAANLFADAVRDAFDPRIRKQ